MENIDLRVMNINNIASDLAKNAHKWLLGLRKVKCSKKKLNFANWTYLMSCIMKKKIFYYGREKQCFFLIFTMKLFSTALSYVTAQSTLNFTRTSLHF